MKSLLQDASSVQKAIIRAWLKAEKPRDFSIKILEIKQESFLWLFKKSNVIVSINYKEKSFNNFNNKYKYMKKKEPEKKHQSFHKKEEPLVRKNIELRPLPAQQNTNTDKEDSIWEATHIQYVEKKLKEIIQAMNITTIITSKYNKKTLNIYFSQNIAETTTNEKRLHISLSYILTQSLKKFFKKKFIGFQLIISSKNSNDSTTKTLTN
jgi:predicted RNA-binding protein Jag